jgi:hypothetical protein
MKIRNSGTLQGLNVQPLAELTERDLRKAFSNVSQNTPWGHKVCFFIDGIDEYDGDHHMISVLLKTSCGSDVKMVLSSRPIPACSQVLGKCAGLRLQDLMRADIEIYINGRLRSNPRMESIFRQEPTRAAVLMEMMLDRAEGVFLWVVLVVSSLLQGLANRDTILDLESRLDVIPPQLEDLYHHMFQQLDPLYRLNASQLLQLTLCSQDMDLYLTLLHLSFADDEDPTTVFNSDPDST